jgi:hypothetical protein
MSWVFYHNEQKKVCYVPLKDIKYTYNVNEDAYECVCTQEYENTGEVPIETYYKYPVYCQASLVGVVVKTDEYEITCNVKEKEEAKKEYKEAVANGDQAVLVSEETEEQYDIKIGNMKPHQAMRVELTYLCELEYDNQHKGYKVILPMTITPRYDPKLGCLNVITPEGKSSYADNVNYQVSELKINVDLRSNIDDVVCISHPYDMKGSKESNKCTYTMSNLFPEKDVIFIIKTKQSENYAYQVGDVLKVHINQQLEMERLQQELANTDVCENIFVLDQSGSMYGNCCEHGERQQMVVASQLVKDMIGNLKCGKDYFNYYRFGSTFEKLLPHSVILDEKSIVNVISYIDTNVQNELGGTETFRPLKDIFDTPKPEGIHKRNIMIVTDGEITNIDEVAKLCRSDGETNIFVVGIGNGISHLFCKALTDDGMGYSTIISTHNEDCKEENIRGKAKEMVQGMLSKSVDMDFVIDGVSTKKERFQHLVNLNRYFKVDHACKNVDIIVGDNHTLIFVNNETITGEHTPTERFYYKKEINHLENQTYYCQDKSLIEENKKTLIGLSKKYNILTRYTSFIGVKKMTNKIGDGNTVTVEIPLQIPSKYRLNGVSSGSCSTSTGSLIVCGGVGISKDLYVGGNLTMSYTSFDCATKSYIDSTLQSYDVSSAPDRHRIVTPRRSGGASSPRTCVDTSETTMKNANYDIRSDPVCPKLVESLWSQSSLEQTAKSIYKKVDNKPEIDVVNNIQKQIAVTENIDLTKWYDIIQSYGVHKMFIVDGFTVVLSGQANKEENGIYSITTMKPFDTMKYYQHMVSTTEIYYLLQNMVMEEVY